MLTEFVVGQTVRHLDLDPSIIGVVESYLPVSVHIVGSPVREMLNVKIGADDLVWWNVDRVAPVPAVNISLSVPTLEPVPTLATL